MRDKWDVRSMTGVQTPGENVVADVKQRVASGMKKLHNRLRERLKVTMAAQGRGLLGKVFISDDHRPRFWRSPAHGQRSGIAGALDESAEDAWFETGAQGAERSGHTALSQHIEARTCWVQQKTRDKKLKVRVVDTDHHTAETITKFPPREADRPDGDIVDRCWFEPLSVRVPPSSPRSSTAR